MPHFIHDEETITTKANLSPPGADLTKYWTSDDANNLRQDLYDLRDGAAGGVTWRRVCRAATTANITLSGTQTVDSVALGVGDTCLVKNQSTASQNGPYVVASGAWTRRTDFDTSQKAKSGSVFPVAEGGQAGTAWRLSTADPITLGSTNLTFTQWPVTTAAFGEISQQGNASATTISDTTNFFLVNLSAPALSGLESQFDNPSGHRLRYTGATTKTFAVSAVYISTGGSTLPSVIMFRISKNGTEIAKSENAVRVSTATGEHGSCQVLVSLATNDYLELEVRNFTAVSNVTVTYLNLRAVEA